MSSLLRLHTCTRLTSRACRCHLHVHSATNSAREVPAQIASLQGHRGVLRLAGADLIDFLQGLLSNDVKPLSQRATQPTYATLLNAQGRFLFDMFLYRAEGDALLADVDADSMPDLLKLLTRYKLRSKVDIADASSEHSVWVRFGRGQLPEGDWLNDPRLAALGQRLVMGAGDKPSCLGEESETDAVAYADWRMEHGVAEGPVEIPAGKAMPLEYNLDALGGISYTKGCYVGQELVARTHNRGVVRKRLMPVAIEGGEAQSGAEVTAEGGASAAGRLVAVSALRGKGLAHLRLRQGLEAAEQQLALVDAASGAHIIPRRPDWWPQEWGHEEEEGSAA